MKRVVSVSLGSSRRDKTTKQIFMGEEFEISRMGTNGDMKRYAELLQELDGKVDAIGLGGIDRYLYAGDRRYTIRDAEKLARLVKTTPVVDGSGIKNTLERETIEWLQREGIVDLGTKNVLLVSAVDRFGMAEVIAKNAKKFIFGDMMFSLGIPLPVKSWGLLKILAFTLLPVISRVPFQWLYPTGEKQDKTTPKYEDYFRWADVIAGDTHFIIRYMPGPESSALRGKTIITNTLTESDIQTLTERGVDTVITSTKEFDGRTFATNVVEGIIITVAGKRPEEMTTSDYMETLNKMDWKPTVRRLGQ